MHFTKYHLTILSLYINLLLEVPTISVYVHKLSKITISIISLSHNIIGVQS